MTTRPTLSDLQASKGQFQAGDRLLVRVSRDLSKEEHAKIAKIVSRYAGNDVRVLVVNLLRTKILWIRNSMVIGTLASPDLIPASGLENVVNLKGSKVPLEPGDVLQVIYNRPLTQDERRIAVQVTKEWAGPDVGVEVFATR